MKYYCDVCGYTCTKDAINKPGFNSCLHSSWFDTRWETEKEYFEKKQKLGKIKLPKPPSR